MKEHVQKTGVRKYAGDDLIELQSEPLQALQKLFEPYGMCVIQGCEVTPAGNLHTVAPGMVALSGKDAEGVDTFKVVRFAGAENVALPIYLTLSHTVQERAYGDGKVKPVAYNYVAAVSGVQPADVPFLEITATGGRQFVDAIKVTEKLEKTGNGKDVTVTFAEASTRENVGSGERLSVLFGKVRKWFSSMAAVAFSGKAADLTTDDGHLLTTKTEKTEWNSKAAGVHGHGIAQVEELQGALDAKISKSSISHIENGDMNNYQETGIYNYAAGNGTMANKPQLKNEYGTLFVVNSGDFISQTIISNAAEMAYRSMWLSNNIWNSWSVSAIKSEVQDALNTKLGNTGSQTITGNDSVLALNSTSATSYLMIKKSGVDKAYFGLGSPSLEDIQISAYNGNVVIAPASGKKAYYNNNEIATVNQIPTTLPANGGNADTLSTLPASSFLKYGRAYSNNTTPDIWNKREIAELYKTLPDGLSGAYDYGTLINLSGDTTKFQIYAPHVQNGVSSFFFRTGYGTDKKDWKRVATTDDIPTSLPANGGNADTVGNFPINNLLHEVSTTTIQAENTNYPHYGFGYEANGFPTNGSYISFGGLNNKYCTQIQSNYGDGSEFFFRTRNDDKNTWNSWRRLVLAEELPTSLPANGGNADTLGGLSKVGFLRSFDTVNIGGSSGDITTGEFINILDSLGAFNLWACSIRGSWYFAGNKTIVDSGVGRIHLAGSTIEVYRGENEKRFTIRITTASAGSNANDSTNSVFIYTDNDGSKGWFKLANSTDIPTSLPANGGNADTLDNMHASAFATAGHTHNYEPAFAKNSAFNKNFGTLAGTVAQGNHSHSGVTIMKAMYEFTWDGTNLKKACIKGDDIVNKTDRNGSGKYTIHHNLGHNNYVVILGAGKRDSDVIISAGLTAQAVSSFSVQTFIRDQFIDGGFTATLLTF